MKNPVWIMMMICILWLLPAANLKAEEATPKLKFSFIERLRFVSWDNTINLLEKSSDTRTFTRHRTSVMAQWFPNPDIEVAVKLTNEFRYYLAPKQIDFEIHEIFFDQLYFRWKNPGKLPLTLTLGRQNIILGEGFIVMDGHPLDGSRSIYFNATRVDFQLNKNHTLTAFFTYQPETDDILPIINDQDQPLVESQEKGIGLYYTGKLNKTGIEGYFIRKDTDASEIRPASSGINTVGARVSHPLTERLSFTIEGAIQFGTQQPLSDVPGIKVDRKALGGYFHLDYTFAEAVPLLEKLTLGGIYLSGDDPGTPDIEGWDPVFSRWPKWSESYIYTQIRENSVGYWSNLNSLYVSVLMDITKPMTLQFTFHHLTANEFSPGSLTAGGGKIRGNLVIGKLEFPINKYFTGHFLWEYFKPGNFYFVRADAAHWLRFELLFKI